MFSLGSDIHRHLQSRGHLESKTFRLSLCRCMSIYLFTLIRLLCICVLCIIVNEKILEIESRTCCVAAVKLQGDSCTVVDGSGASDQHKSTFTVLVLLHGYCKYPRNRCKCPLANSGCAGASVAVQ